MFTLKRLGGLKIRSLGSKNRRMSTRVVQLSEEVAAAQHEGRAVVALESTIISHGMPYPENVKTATAVEAIVRENGAVPATVAVMDGKLLVGLQEQALDRLARAGQSARKCSRRDLAYALAHREIGATTVAATMIAAHKANIRIFVTGGIGGVHRGYESTQDMSADLTELSRTPVAVVCAGVKSILDIPRTIEALETLGVAVGTWKADEFPAFFTPHSGVKSPLTFQSADEVAATLRAYDELQLDSGLVLGVPNPSPADSTFIEESIQQALREANESNIAGKDATPFLLKRVNELTSGASLKSNIALVKNNAAIGAQVAHAYALHARANLNGSHSSNPFSHSQRRFQHTLPNRLSGSTDDSSDISTIAPVVIGGACLDMIAKPYKDQPFTLRTSNPGIVTQQFGGVGRNIAGALAKLSGKPLFLTNLGADTAGKALRDHLSDFDMEYMIAHDMDKNTNPNQNDSSLRTAVYSAMFGEDGDLIGAVADMQCLERIGAANISSISEKVVSAPIVVADGNLTSETISALCVMATQTGSSAALDSVLEQLNQSSSRATAASKSPLQSVNLPEQIKHQMAGLEKQSKSMLHESNDAELAQATIQTTAEVETSTPGVPVWFEPTSVEKAKRAVRPDLLAQIAVISPNADEIVSMADELERLTTDFMRVANEENQEKDKTFVSDEARQASFPSEQQAPERDTHWDRGDIHWSQTSNSRLLQMSLDNVSNTHGQTNLDPSVAAVDENPVDSLNTDETSYIEDGFTEYSRQRGVNLTNIDLDSLRASLESSEAQQQMEAHGVTREQIEEMLAMCAVQNEDGSYALRNPNLSNSPNNSTSESTESKPSKSHSPSQNSHSSDSSTSTGRSSNTSQPGKDSNKRNYSTNQSSNPVGCHSHSTFLMDTLQRPAYSTSQVSLSKKQRSQIRTPDPWKNPRARTPKVSHQTHDQPSENQYTSVQVDADFTTVNRDISTSVHKGYEGDERDVQLKRDFPETGDQTSVLNETDEDEFALDMTVLEAAQRILAAMCHPAVSDMNVGLIDGMKHVVVTMGRHGILWLSAPPCQNEEHFINMSSLPFFQASIQAGFDFSMLRPPKADMKNCTGAGDNLVAGTVYALSKGHYMNEALLYGLGAAHIAVESDEAIPPELSPTTLQTALLKACEANPGNSAAQSILQQYFGIKPENVQDDDLMQSSMFEAPSKWSDLAQQLQDEFRTQKRQERGVTKEGAEDIDEEYQDILDMGGSHWDAMMASVQSGVDQQVEQFERYRRAAHEASHRNASKLTQARKSTDETEDR